MTKRRRTQRHARAHPQGDLSPGHSQYLTEGCTWGCTEAFTQDSTACKGPSRLRSLFCDLETPGSPSGKGERYIPQVC